jgi:hypothetical protein
MIVGVSLATVFNHIAFGLVGELAVQALVVAVEWALVVESIRAVSIQMTGRCVQFSATIRVTPHSEALNYFTRLAVQLPTGADRLVVDISVSDLLVKVHVIGTDCSV